MRYQLNSIRHRCPRMLHLSWDSCEAQRGPMSSATCFQGTCSPAIFGGSCSGTPKECKDCSSVTKCDDSVEEPELEQTNQMKDSN